MESALTMDNQTVRFLFGAVIGYALGQILVTVAWAFWIEPWLERREARKSAAIRSHHDY